MDKDTLKEFKDFGFKEMKMDEDKIKEIWERQNWSELSFGEECYNQAIIDIEKEFIRRFYFKNHVLVNVDMVIDFRKWLKELKNVQSK